MPVERLGLTATFNLHLLEETLTPEGCAEFRRQTGRTHPSSRWCGLVSFMWCGTDGAACDGRCKAWRALTPEARSGFLRLCRGGREPTNAEFVQWAAEHNLPLREGSI